MTTTTTTQISSAANMSLDKKDYHDFSKEDVEQIEHVDPLDYGKKDQSDLSGIESTAASTTAWLISIVVSIGGLLFGVYFTPCYDPSPDLPFQDMILAISPQS